MAINGYTSGTYAQAYTTRIHLEVQKREWEVCMRVGEKGGETERSGVGCNGVEGGVAWRGEELNGVVWCSVAWTRTGVEWSEVGWGRLE